MARAISWRLTAIVAVIAVGWLAGAPRADADPPPPAPREEASNALCLLCHQKNLAVDDGATGHRVVKAVRGWAFATSAHKEMGCVECHTDQTALPHQQDPALPAASSAVSCAGCHADAYEGYREGPHGPVAELGDARAPACANCHGNPHYVQSAQEWDETDQAAACAKCHEGAGPGFLGAWPGHRSPSAGFLSTPYFAGLFLMVLTAATLGFGIVHVELEVLRWLVARLARSRGADSAKGA